MPGMNSYNRYFIVLDYSGTHFCGYQIQPNARTVQEEVEQCLSKLMRKKTPIVGCGRTDTGVHAKNYIAHFDSEVAVDDLEYLKYKLNRMLPRDIYVHQVIEVESDVHARFSAQKRTYYYDLSLRKNPFLSQFVAVETRGLDFEKMNEAAHLLLEMEDFTSFCKLHSDNKTNICDVSVAKWYQIEPEIWRFEITANRFLRNMVRAVVGSLVEVGLGNWDLEKFKEVCNAKDRGQAGTSAKASGLHLVKVEYPQIKALHE